MRHHEALLHAAVLPNGRSFPRKASPKVVFYQILPMESVSKLSTEFFLRKGSPKFLSYRSNSTLTLRLTTFML